MFVQNFKITIFVLFLGSKVKAFPWTGPQWVETPPREELLTWPPMRYDVSVSVNPPPIRPSTGESSRCSFNELPSSLYRVPEETQVDFLCHSHVLDHLSTTSGVGSKGPVHARLSVSFFLFFSPPPRFIIFLHTHVHTVQYFKVQSVN